MDKASRPNMNQLLRAIEQSEPNKPASSTLQDHNSQSTGQINKATHSNIEQLLNNQLPIITQ